MERDCESELSKLNIEQNACIYHFGASVIHGQRSNILRLLKKDEHTHYDKKKKDVAPNRQLAQAILNQYQPKSVEDMQDALKDIFGSMFEAMLQGEMNSHLGYSNNERSEKETTNRRNGYTKKTLKTTVGDVPIEVPRDREGTFEPAVVPKRKRDVSDIQDKVLSMYAKGMSRRDNADTIEDIYGFEISHETISEITDSVLEQLEEWQNRLLKRFYTFLFVDCLYVAIRKEYPFLNHYNLFDFIKIITISLISIPSSTGIPKENTVPLATGATPLSKTLPTPASFRPAHTPPAHPRRRTASAKRRDALPV